MKKIDKFEIILGELIEKRIDSLRTFEQKGTDIQIALEMVKIVLDYGPNAELFLISGDSDFVPAVEFVQERGLDVTLVDFIGAVQSTRLTNKVNSRCKISIHELLGLRLSTTYS